MYSSRRCERPRNWFRSNRVFAMNGQWFFSTREGIEVGPYTSHDAADRAARNLGEQLAPMCPGRQSRAVVCQFIYDACSSGQMLSPQFGVARAG